LVQIDFLLVIDTNLPPILHRFRDIAFDRFKIAIFGYGTPLAFNPPPAGGVSSLGTISVKFSVDVSGWPRYQWRRNIASNFDRLSRVHERYRQTTDGRATANSERELEFTFAPKPFVSMLYCQFGPKDCNITARYGI